MFSRLIVSVVILLFGGDLLACRQRNLTPQELYGYATHVFHGRVTMVSVPSWNEHVFESNKKIIPGIFNEGWEFRIKLHQALKGESKSDPIDIEIKPCGGPAVELGAMVIAFWINQGWRVVRDQDVIDEIVSIANGVE